VTNASGSHLPQLTNNDITGFSLNEAPNLNKFPKNLELVFKNLISIEIFFSRLRELSHDDLHGFPLLKFLSLSKNQIKVIRDGTFRSNPELELIELDGNQLLHVDQKSFSGLWNLSVLWLSGNVCASLDNAETRDEVLGLVRRIDNGECRKIEVVREVDVE
jgi:Leucine-rich repeat (LRR) protein